MNWRAHPVWSGVGAVIVGGIVIAIIVLAWPAGRAQDVPVPTSDPQLVMRGKYVATAADCIACHTAPGGTQYAGGRVFKLPFGTIVAPNITPDRETGIGGWSAGEFVRALRQGVGRHGEELYPAFPYTSYTRMTDEDAVALWAYLSTLAPVRNAVPPNDLRFPFDQRRLMRFWKALFFDRKPLRQEANQPPEWNRGEYLVTVLGHCGECHTPRNFLYGRTQRHALAGETMQGWTAWNITSDSTHGIGEWSDTELAMYLRTGYAPGRAAASGPMKEAVDYSLGRLSEQDLHAISVYLKSVPAIASGPVSAKNVNVAAPDHAEGERVFEGACMGCHLPNGEGRQTAIAELRGRRSVSDPDGRNVIQVILRGGGVDVAQEHAMMPAFNAAYSDAEIAAAANYVITRFGAQKGAVSARDVHRARDE